MGDIKAADLFCGGGGTSTGLAYTCIKLAKAPSLVAVNHWDIAIQTHQANHPWAKHLCTGLDSIHPALEIPGGHLDILVASPECTNHSNARGGKPMCDQSRSSPWLIMKWLADLCVRSVLIENIPEFTRWGPLGTNGRPLVSKQGDTFESFIQCIKSMGYNVEYRELVCADYGDPTTRKRLFIQAKRGKDKRIYWPKQTHYANPDQLDMFESGDRQRWRPAREIIDWTIPSQSIFRRKKPLAASTLERIAAGIKKYCSEYAEPFLVVLRNHMEGRSIHEPLPTVTAGGTHIGLAQPFIFNMQRHKDPIYNTDRPMPTVTATSSDYGMAQPFFVQAGGPEGKARHPGDIDEPMATILKENHTALVRPFIMSMEHAQKNGFLIPVNHGQTKGGSSRTYSMDNPMPTVTTVDAWAMVNPFLVEACHKEGTAGRAHSVERPLGTVLGSNRFGLAQPKFITEYHRDGGNLASLENPLPTVDTGDRFALVELDKNVTVDIHFRMLHWRELAAAQSFPKDYKFCGTREQIVAQIGNAVPVRTAEALTTSLLGG